MGNTKSERNPETFPTYPYRHCPSDISDPSFGSGIWVRNRGLEYSRPWENTLNQESPQSILFAQNLGYGEFWGNIHGFEGIIPGSKTFYRIRKIPDP